MQIGISPGSPRLPPKLFSKKKDDLIMHCFQNWTYVGSLMFHFPGMSFFQDKFWKHASLKWQAMEVNKDNIKALALDAAAEFLAEFLDQKAQET